MSPAAGLNIVHVADRVSLRGGADIHLCSVVSTAPPSITQELVTGVLERGVAVPVVATVCPELASRDESVPLFEKFVSESEVDVVHIHNVVNPTFLEQMVGAKVVITVQDHKMFCPGRGKWIPDVGRCHSTFNPVDCAKCFTEEDYFHRIVHTTERRRAALVQMPSVVVLSEYMKSELIKVGVQKDRVHVLPPTVYGVNEPLSNAQHAEPKPSKRGSVLFVGRLVEAKGVRDVVEAWQLADVGKPLVIAGAGPERGRLCDVPGVQWEGWVSRERLSALYEEASVVVMASRWEEPYGIVGVEALSKGVSVAAWDSGGVEEWMVQEPSPWGDVQALAQQIRLGIERTQPPVRFWSGAERWRALERIYQRVASDVNSSAD